MNKLIYVMDPMCGWCFGFGQTMAQVMKKYEESLEIEVLPGGMWIDDGMVATNKALYTYIKQSIGRIEQMSGVTFGAPYMDYLAHEGRLLDSLPASKAIVAVSELAPDLTARFVGCLQQKIFVEGRGLTAGQWEAFAEAAVEAGLKSETFIEAYHSQRTAEMTRFAFRRVKSMGINGFPALMLQHDEKLRSVTSGFEAFETLEKKLEALLTYHR